MIKSKYLIPVITAALAVSSVPASADHHKKILYKDAIAPVLGAKCGGCHGEKKKKGKLRMDSLAAMIKGGSEGASLVPGKPGESSIMQRVHLPLDDDEHMPPEDKDQLTADEIVVIEFWIKSGAKENATIESLKATAAINKAITAVLANPSPSKMAKTKSSAPKAISGADKKLIADTIKKVNAGGGNLMAIAQNTPQLRFSALNVAKEFGDNHLEPLKAVGQHILWLDLARTQITDSGLASLSSMKNLTRLHLENTKISDSGLDHVRKLQDLEYLNLYGTGITDAGIAKLSGNKKLKKLFLWQTKATEKGVMGLAKAVPGIDINTGWKEPVVVAVAATVAAVTKPPAPKKPVTPPAKKPAPKKPVKPSPVAKKAPVKVTPKGTLQAALVELTVAAAKSKKEAAEAKSAYEMALKKADVASQHAETMKAAADHAAEIDKKTNTALKELKKAVDATRK